MSVPRRKGRALEPLEVEHLQLILRSRARSAERALECDELLEDFVLRCRESGSSARVMAEQLHVSPSSIHHWTERARRRQKNHPQGA